MALGLRSFAVWFALAATASLAQVPATPPSRNQQAAELAKRLGREQSAEGLETILRAQNVDLLTQYVHGFRDATMRAAKDGAKVPMRADIEALVVKYYPDPNLGGTLKDLFAAGWCRYQTRALFDLLMADWRSGKRRGGVYDMREAVLRTDAPGVEAPLLDYYRSLADPVSFDGNEIAHFFAERGYRPAIPALAAAVRAAKPDATGSAIGALAQLGGTEASAV